jgi:hypothetical protein
MKKISSMYALILAVVLLFSACALKTDPDSTTKEIDNSAQTGNNSSSPPLQLFFANINEILALEELLNKNDNDLQKFLENKNYYMNGISNRSSLINVINTLSGIPFPHNDKLEISQIIYFPEKDKDYVFITYRLESGEVVGIGIPTYTNNFEEQIESYKDMNPGMVSKITSQNGKYDCYIYEPVSKSDATIEFNRFFYILNVDSYCIHVTISKSADQNSALEILRSFTFEQIALKKIESYGNNSGNGTENGNN